MAFFLFNTDLACSQIAENHFQMYHRVFPALSCSVASGEPGPRSSPLCGRLPGSCCSQSGCGTSGQARDPGVICSHSEKKKINGTILYFFVSLPSKVVDLIYFPEEEKKYLYLLP